MAWWRPACDFESDLSSKHWSMVVTTLVASVRQSREGDDGAASIARSKRGSSETLRTHHGEG